MSHRRRKYKPGSVISGTSYRVLRHIGSGAMGAVYEALHCELKKVFVIKVLHNDLVQHDDPVRRLRCEWELLAKLDHPNIVSVTDAGFTEQGIPYFVMERMEGETLYARMNREPRWSVPSCVQLALELLEGLVEAHAKGIVHRDIKPSNIFLSRQFGAKLLDFGIAKLLTSSATITAKGVTLGTPRYMAPEQACGQFADCRSDLYALGVILFELVAGEHPFAQAQNPVEMLIAQAGWDPPPLLIGGLSQNDEFISLVRGLMSKDPGARPATAAAARDCFREILSNLALSPSGDQNLMLDDAAPVNNLAPFAERTRKLAFAREARLSRPRREKCRIIGNRQDVTILGRRGFSVRCGSVRQASVAGLIAIAALSVSSLATPFPIHRVLSTVWPSGRSSTTSLASKGDGVAGFAVERRNSSCQGQLTSLRTPVERSEAELGIQVIAAVAASGQQHEKTFAAQFNTIPKKANSKAVVELTTRVTTQVLRPNETTKSGGSDQSQRDVEYESLTRR